MQNIALEVDAGRDLDNLQSAIRRAQHGTLGDENGGSALSLGKARVVADLLDLADELRVLAFLHDAQLPIGAQHFEPTAARPDFDN
jgi:hypothetical protein